VTPQQAQQLAALNAPEPATTRLVPAERTPWTTAQVGQELVAAWHRRFGSGPTARSIAILLSQWALETGRGRSCFASNLGNARPPATRGDVLCCQLTRVSEVIGGVEYFFAPPSVGSTFRAFASLAEGADFYLGLLFTRFQRAWPAVLAGDPERYSLALAELGYYSANPTLYTRTMVALFNEFLSIAIMGSSGTSPTDVPDELVSESRRAQLDEWLLTLDVDPSTPAQNLDTADTDPSDLAPESAGENQS